jgi:hypothetical protein
MKLLTLSVRERAAPFVEDARHLLELFVLLTRDYLLLCLVERPRYLSGHTLLGQQTAFSWRPYEFAKTGCSFLR